MQVFKLSWAVTPDDDDYVNPAEFHDGACVTITHTDVPIKYGTTTWDIVVERLLIAAREAYQQQYEGITPDWKLPVEDVLARKLTELGEKHGVDLSHLGA